MNTLEQRNIKIFEIWKTGNYSKAELARMHRVSGERVRQIIAKHERMEREQENQKWRETQVI